MPFAVFLEIDILFSFYVFPHVSQAQVGLGNHERGFPVTSAEASSALKATVLIVLVSWVGRSRPFRGHCQQLSYSVRMPPTSHSCLPGVESMAGPRCSRHLPTAVPDTALMSFAGTSQGVTSPISVLWVEMNAVSLPPCRREFLSQPGEASIRHCPTEACSVNLLSIHEPRYLC